MRPWNGGSLVLAAALVALMSPTSGATGATPTVVLAFPNGGDAGADGIRADAAATDALQRHGVMVVHVNLDPGVQNAHEDEGTDDERAVARVAKLPAFIGRLQNLRGIIIGPTRAIVDAAGKLDVHVQVVAVAPLIAHGACTCPTESALFRRHRNTVIEAVDGRSWHDSRNVAFATLAGAVGRQRNFYLVNQRGYVYYVPGTAREAVLRASSMLDHRDFSASRMGLTAQSTWDQKAVDAAAAQAARKLLRTTRSTAY